MEHKWCTIQLSMCVVFFWIMRWIMDHVLFVCIKQNNIYSHNLSNPVEQNIERVSQTGWLYKVRRTAGCKAQTGRLRQKGETQVRGSRLYLPPSTSCGLWLATNYYQDEYNRIEAFCLNQFNNPSCKTHPFKNMLGQGNPNFDHLFEGYGRQQIAVRNNLKRIQTTPPKYCLATNHFLLILRSEHCIPSSSWQINLISKIYSVACFTSLS